MNQPLARLSRPRARALWVVAGTAALTLAACHHDGDAVLLVVVTASGSPPPVSALDVTLSGPAGTFTAHYTRDDTAPIAFPTTLTAVVPAQAVGGLFIDVQAEDPTGATVATGHAGPVMVAAGSRETFYVEIDCAGNPCVADGGAGAGGDGGTPDASPGCGNGRVDPGETCDTAIARGSPGACPPSDCDDGVACTRDLPSGNACTATCTHQEITLPAAGDGCCPTGATIAEDPDCSATCGNGVVDAHETCDIAIPAGSPGACPAGAADCTSGDACAVDQLIAAGTCSAICVHYPIATQSLKKRDGCCPPGATNAVDDDCPVVCGDGVPESGENCDVGIPPLSANSCPVSCDDGDACTTDFVAGAGCAVGCVHVRITARVSGDGCCPMGANRSTDSDCPAACGDGVLEPGEACDKMATGPNACPTSCPPPPSACLVVSPMGLPDDCSALCATTTITECSAQKDGCCPAGCTNATDPDCSPRCGDGALEPTLGEVCDIAIPAGHPGACPTSCASSNPCIDARLLSAGTCAAKCVLLPVTTPRAGDGCCPFGADFTVDADCAPVCGNGVVESPAEHCDFGLGPDSCPLDCPAAGACTIVEAKGAAADCSASCVSQPIVACLGGDGCCPPGCTSLTDADCPVVCGNGAVEPGEACDRAITAGVPGACPRSCDDGDACTLDLADGSVEGCTRTCVHVPTTACLDGDGCCPAGCTAASDDDCNPVCGDGHLGAGETCDPPAACPTACPDDGDPCTRERLTGDPATCTATCAHVPITACSGSTADACCPTGCSPASDTDC